MEKFKTIKLQNEPYDFLVIATSYENPIGEIDEVKSQIGVDDARVLFDLMLINGTKRNRFIELSLQKGLTTPSYSLGSNVTDSIKKISSNFFVQNHDLVDKSVLPKALKYLIKQNLINML